MEDQEPQPGLDELIAYLESRGVRMALCTRNFEYIQLQAFLLKKPLPSSLPFIAGAEIVPFKQRTRDASPADVSSRQDVRTHRHEGVQTAEATPGRYPPHCESVAVG